MVAATTALPPRTEIDENYTWNAPSVFADWHAWEVEAESVPQEFAALKAYQG